MGIKTSPSRSWPLVVARRPVLYSAKEVMMYKILVGLWSLGETPPRSCWDDTAASGDPGLRNTNKKTSANTIFQQNQKNIKASRRRRGTLRKVFWTFFKKGILRCHFDHWLWNRLDNEGDESELSLPIESLRVRRSVLLRLTGLPTLPGIIFGGGGTGWKRDNDRPSIQVVKNDDECHTVCEKQNKTSALSGQIWLCCPLNSEQD